MTQKKSWVKLNKVECETIPYKCQNLLRATSNPSGVPADDSLRTPNCSETVPHGLLLFSLPQFCDSFERPILVPTVRRRKRKRTCKLIDFSNHWLLGSLRHESGSAVLFLSQIPQWKQLHKQREKSMDFLWQLSEWCLASQRACLRWTSQSVLWCCSIALFTSASCFKPIWSEAHRVLTTTSTSVNSLLGPSHSIQSLKWFLSSAEHLYIPALEY